MMTMVIFSCKKTDENPPQITISSPSIGSNYLVLDTIHVAAHVSDDKSLNYVKLSLLNADYISVGNVVSFPVTSVSMDIKTDYIIDNPDLPTGDYYITVSANDGRNSTNSYRMIHVSELPKKRKAIYVITGSNNGNTKVFKVDTGNAISPVISLSGDFVSSGINSRDQNLYTVGMFSGDFNSINLNSNAINWQVNNPNDNFPNFQYLYNYGLLTYIADYDRTIKGYDKGNNVSFSTTTAENTYPHILFMSKDYMFAEQRNYSGSDVRIEVYYVATGYPRQEIGINQDVVSMYSIDANHLIVFTNNADNGNILEYDLDANNIYQKHSCPAGKIYSTVQINPDIYLIGHESGILFYNTNSAGSIGNYFPVINSPVMQYDSLNNQLLVANGKQMNVYDYGSSSLINTLTFSDTLKGINILYNK